MNPVDWLNQNQGFTNALLSLLLVGVSFQLWWLERDRGQANFQLRAVFNRDMFDDLSKTSKVWFALANTGGMASPPDPARTYVLIARGTRFVGLLTKWEKVGLEIYTQQHYLQMESAQKGWKDSVWANVGDKEKDTSLRPGAINAYVGRFHWVKPEAMYTPAKLVVAPVKGRARCKKFQAG